MYLEELAIFDLKLCCHTDEAGIVLCKGAAWCGLFWLLMRGAHVRTTGNELTGDNFDILVSTEYRLAGKMRIIAWDLGRNGFQRRRHNKSFSIISTNAMHRKNKIEVVIADGHFRRRGGICLVFV